ncbi:MAG TPA: MXAN_5187 C-terminal domain-containing protein [Minicystis sp.]|nr:MXAN_5187 C-terminal domain-containing protein [Minicystis sp.]
MRGKIIAVFALVVLVVGGLGYALTRATLGDFGTSGDAPRALSAASAELQLQGLLLERWLAAHGNDASVRAPFDAGTQEARGEAATDVANKLREAAAANPDLASMSPSLVVLVDKQGVVLGRNGSALMRGDDLGAVYPALKQALEKGITGSDVWVNAKRNEQYLASYAPIRDTQGQVIGGIAVGTNINDERLQNTSDKTSGKILLAAVKGDKGLDIVAKSQGASPDAVAAVQASKETAQALTTGVTIEPENLPREYSGAAHDLDGYGDGRRLVLVCLTRSQTGALLAALAWPALGATLLGLILVVAGGFLLGGYIQKPISELEDGLLAIMNGRTDLRFQIEHAELGGLVFRLNSLLNQLFGVAEDDTDSEGRPSRAPTAAGFQEALAVDERMAALSSNEIADSRSLRDEPEAAYYDRIFAEYIRAKRELGDPTDHITKDAFVDRLRESERETSEKHGKPVRYKVEVRGKEVVLLAVPLA